MENERQMTTAEVEQVLKEFVRTGELTTRLSPSHFLWEIHQSWRRRGTEALPDHHSGGGRRPGRNIRRLLGRTDGQKYYVIRNAAGKMSGRAPFKAPEVAILLGLLFRTWRGDELTEKNQFTELVGYEVKLAQVLCPDGSKLTMLSPGELASATTSEVVHACTLASKIPVVVQDWIAGTGCITVLCLHPFGSVETSFSVVSISLSARTLVEIEAERQGKMYRLLTNPQTHQGFVLDHEYTHTHKYRELVRKTE